MKEEKILHNPTTTSTTFNILSIYFWNFTIETHTCALDIGEITLCILCCNSSIITEITKISLPIIAYPKAGGLPYRFQFIVKKEKLRFPK